MKNLFWHLLVIRTPGGSMRPLARGLLIICAITAILVPLPPAVAQTPGPGLDWRPCPAPFPTSATPVVDPADFPPGLECATLSVPLDYGRPVDEQITIGLNRLPAIDPTQRIGSLIFNPGGPGGAASEVIALEALGVSLFTPAVREQFDLIGMDPRGVGSSTPVRCDPVIWNDVVSWFPDDEETFTELRDHYRSFGESCLEMTGPLLNHLDTASVARDLEAVRLALSEGKLNFLGLSYGSERGTEAMVLEMAMRGAGQIAELVAIAEPDVGVIVNVGPVHLELLGTIEAVAAAKAELIRDLSPGATAIVPANEPLLEPHLRKDIATITFGDGGDVALTDYADGIATYDVNGA